MIPPEKDLLLFGVLPNATHNVNMKLVQINRKIFLKFHRSFKENFGF